VSGTIADGQNLYFRVDAVPGSDFTISGDFAASSEAELYVRRGDVPDRSIFDQMAEDVSSRTPEVLLENPSGGVYYVLLHGREGAGNGRQFTIQADVVPFAIRNISPTQGSNRGTSTITLESSGLTPSASVSLRAGAVTRPASTVTFVDSGRLFVT